MNIVFDLFKLSESGRDKIDFSALIFKAELPSKIDVDNSWDLWVFLKTLISGGALKIFIDMNHLEYIDSSGIGVLVNAAKLMRKQEGDIVMANVSDQVKGILKVINLENYIKLYNSEAEAVGSFN